MHGNKVAGKTEKEITLMLWVWGSEKKNAVVPLKQISMHNHNALKDEIKT